MDYIKDENGQMVFGLENDEVKENFDSDMEKEDEVNFNDASENPVNDQADEAEIIRGFNGEDINIRLGQVVDELRRICNRNRLPMFLAIGVGHTEEGMYNIREDVNYETAGELTATAILPEIMNIKTKDRRFNDFVNVVNGFQTIMKPVMEIDDDELDFPELE